MRALLIAARRPLFLAVLLVAVVAGITLARWMFPLGLVVYVAAVVLASREPGLVADAERARAQIRITSATLRSSLVAIDRTQRQIDATARQVQAPLSQVVERIRAQTRALVEQAYALAAKGQMIEQFLETVDERQLQDQITQIDVRMPRTTDSYTLQQLKETRAALVDRQNNAQALRTYDDRVTAQLHNIGANLDNVLAEIVRLKTADAVSPDSTTNDVAQRLSDLNADMDAFGHVLDTALAQSGVAA